MLYDFKIDAFIAENFPDRSAFLIPYFKEQIPFLYEDFKVMKGYTPSINLLKTMFVFGLFYSTTKNNNMVSVDSMDVPFLDMRLQPVYNYPENNLFNMSPPEVVSFLTEFNMIGSGGGGGTYFLDFSSYREAIYFSWEEFEVISLVDHSISDLIVRMGASAIELFGLLKSEYAYLYSNNKESENRVDLDLVGLDLYKGIANIAVQIGSNYGTKQIKMKYSMEYFNQFFNDEKSDYFLYDNVVAIVNGKYILACYMLYYCAEKEKLKALLGLGAKLKGKQAIAFCKKFKETIVLNEKLVSNELFIIEEI